MFLSALENIGILLLMAVPGFLISKLKMIDRAGAAKFISVTLLYVTQPFIAINSFLNTPFEKEILWNLLLVFALTAVVIVVVALLGRLIFHFEKDLFLRGMWQYGGGFGNVGFMCIPFLQILAPDRPVVIVYATASVVAFNLVAWTLGNYLITREKKYISLKRAIFNPPTISFLIVLPLFILNLNFTRAPSLQPLQNMCRLFANLVGPLAMTLVGIKFSEITLKSLFLDKKLYLVSAVKLLLAPTVAFAFVKLLGLVYPVEAIALNLIAAASMPVANNSIMFATISGRDADTAARMVLLTTLFSAVTIPLTLTLYL